MTMTLNPFRATVTFSPGDLHWPELTAGDGRTLALLLAFVALFALEARGGYRQHSASTVRQSYWTNLGSFLVNDVLMSLLSVSSLLCIAERYSDVGLLAGISSRVGRAIGSFVLLDLALYFWHRATHSYAFLWMFHRVHHSDRCMNVSTAVRLHGGEIVLTTVVKAVFIVLVGVDATIVLANEAVITLCVLFHHANIVVRGERWMGRVIVVPALHRVHHSTRRREHDHNYAAVFSFWDRLFGTFADLEPAELGLPNVSGQSLIELVNYGLARPPRPVARPVQSMIAEAAYFRAEKRGFVSGHEVADWLEAEREIIAALSAPTAPDGNRSKRIAVFRCEPWWRRQAGTLPSCCAR